MPARAVFSIGRDFVVYVKTSTATNYYDDLQHGDEYARLGGSAADHIHHQSLTLEFEQEQRIRDDKNDSRSVLQIFQMRKSGTITLGAYNLMEGQGKKPQFDAIYKAFFSAATGNVASAAETANPGLTTASAPDTTNLALTKVIVESPDVSGWSGVPAANQPITIQGKTDNKHRLRVIDSFSADTPTALEDTLFVKPKVPFAQLNTITDTTHVVNRGMVYKLNKNVTAHLVVTILGSNECMIATGWVPDTITWRGSGTEPPMVEVTGPVRDVPVYTGTSQIFNEMGAGIPTSFQVKKGDARKFVKGSLVSVWGIAGDAMLGTPNFVGRVTTIVTTNSDYDQINVETTDLDPTSLNPDINDELTPARPGIKTFTGKVIGAKVLAEAGVWMGQTVNVSPITALDDDFFYKATSWEVSITNAIDLINDTYGDDAAIGYTAGRAAVNVTIEAYMSKDLYRILGQAAQFDDLSTLIQVGDTPGAIMGFWMPKVRYNRFGMPNAENDDKVSVTITGQAQGTTGQDEFYLLFV